MLSKSISELIKKSSIKDNTEDARESEAVLEINQLVTKTATFYEKVRYLVDYKEEHTIRRSAIERILRRKLFIESRENVGLSLIAELVGGQYIAEKYHTEGTGRLIDRIINKFLILYSHVEHSPRSRKKIHSLAASEIDYYLDSYAHQIDTFTVEAFCERVRPHITVNIRLEKDELDIALYAACRRNLLGSDDQMLMFSLWRKFVPEWQNIRDDEIPKLAERFEALVEKIDHSIRSPLQWQIAQKLKNETVYFLIIREIVRQYGALSEGVFAKEDELDAYVKNFLEKIYKKENEKIRSRGIRAVIYLFLTKILIAIAFELPYEFFVLGESWTLPLTINIIFPPVLLFLLTRGVKTLDVQNTGAVIQGMHEIVYSDGMKPILIGKSMAKQGLTAIFMIMYVIFIAVIFGLLISLLEVFKFNLVSIVVFIFFLTLVSYFAFRIR
ncbi:MAG: hypothetical protein ABI430_04195, partial [Candidatus Taylorbacteria bacterium]